MPLVSDFFYKKKLKELGINIKTKYYADNKIYERNTNDSINDDVLAGIIKEKEYYIGNKLAHIEKNFDSRMEYTFISKNMENENYTCPNCGMQSKLKDFIDGCPYCKNQYNIDYTDKSLGSKYHYDRVLKSKAYMVITALIDFIISIVISYFFIKGTSRTFNNIDIAKIFIYGFILGLILYYLFYIIDAYVVLGPIRILKDRQNKKQKEFWERTKIDKKTFFNNFVYELRRYYYSKEEVIDFDILDYLEFEDFEKDKESFIRVKAEVRIISYNKNRVSSKIQKEDYVFKKNPNENMELQDGVNIIKCHNCGANIDVTTQECPYCHTEIKYLQKWLLVDKD